MLLIPARKGSSFWCSRGGKYRYHYTGIFGVYIGIFCGIHSSSLPEAPVRLVFGILKIDSALPHQVMGSMGSSLQLALNVQHHLKRRGDVL